MDKTRQLDVLLMLTLHQYVEGLISANFALIQRTNVLFRCYFSGRKMMQF